MIYLKNSIEKQKIYVPRTKIDGKLVIKNKTYDDGYNEGHFDGVTEGYASGYDTGFSNGREYGRSEGKEIQKSKLEDISITENGIYSREDGYKNIVVEVPDNNGSYDDGYDDGSSDGYKEGHYDGLRQGLNDGINYQYEKMVNNSEVLNITENGVYFTKYSKEEDSSEEIPSNNNRNFIRTVNVNIIPKINVAKEKIKFGRSDMVEVPEWADFEGVTDMRYMFNYCTKLRTISYIDTSKVTNMNGMFQGCTYLETIPQLITNNVTNMDYMFQNCSNLITIPQLDTSNVTTMRDMFYSCTKLTTIPLLDTSKVTDMYDLFYGCSNLITISQLDTSKVTNMYSMFASCSRLTSIPLLDFSKVNNIGYFFGYSNITTLTDLGGFKDLKINWNDSNGLSKCPNLTYESVMNVINNLYDFRGNGDSTTTRTIKFHANSLALLSDEDKAIATAKGWILSA